MDDDGNCQPTPSDLELVLAMKAGDAAALAVLYDRYSSLVFRLSLRILNDSEDAADLTQDVFLTLWRGSSYQSERGSLGTFLTTLTRSRAIDRIRSRSSKVKFLQRWSQIMPTQSASNPFEAASIQQRSEYVREAMTQLPAKQRQVLELAYYDGLSQSEIATHLETPLGTVKSWSRQGLLNLRKQLQALFE